MKTLALFLIVASLLAACTGRTNKTDQQVKEKGGQISSKLAKAIMAKLTTEIQAEGIAGAIDYCSVHAIPITDSISQTEQVKISRVSHRYRNSKNAANEAELALIEEYIRQIQGGDELVPKIIKKNGEVIYYAPVVLAAPMCLNCHGKPEEMDISVMEALKQKYPEDKAIKHSLGDLRGLFKIAFEKDKLH